MADLFGYEKPRQSRRVIMRAIDAGQAGYLMPGWETSSGGHFVCDRCGHDDDWTFNLNMTAIKRGLPCPECNKRAATREAEV